MKRQRKDSSNTLPRAPSSDNTNVSKERPPTKRVKAGQACASCRKHKTRCELIGSASYLSRCHRCNVLSISCSFETNAPPIKAVDDSPLAIVRRRIISSILSAPEINSEKCLEQPQSENIPGSNPRSNVPSPWEFLKVPGITDWTATPMLAMLALSKMAREVQPTIQPPAMTNSAFSDVLTDDQRQYLLSLYV